MRTRLRRWCTVGILAVFSAANAMAANGPNCSSLCYGPGTSLDAGAPTTITTTSYYTGVLVKNNKKLVIKSPAILYVGAFGTDANTQVVDFQNGSEVVVEPGASLVVFGRLNNSNNSDQITIDGSVQVYGNVSLGSGSNMSGLGSISATGTMTGGGGAFGTTPSCSTGPCNSCTPISNTITGDQNYCASASATAITGSAVSGGTYQWAKSTTSATIGFADISGATSQDYTPGTVSATTYFLRYVKSGTCTYVSNVITVKIGSTPLSITTPPAAVAVCSGTGTTFTVVASGASMTYKWQQDPGTNVFADISNGGVFSGATTATLAISDVVGKGAYKYRCIVFSTCGTPTSVTSASAVLTVRTRPSSATLSGAGSLCAGGSRNLSVTIVSGTSPYTVVYTPGPATQTGYSSGGNIPVSPSATTTYGLTSVTDANGCTAASLSGTPTISVTPAPTAVAGTAITACTANNSISITTGASATNNAGITWTISGTLPGNISNSTNISTATYAPSATDQLGATRTLTLTATGNSPCANATSTKTITLSALQTSGFSYTGSPYCNTASNPSPTLAGGATAGTFTSTTGLVINSSTGQVNLATSTPGTYTVTNTVGCGTASTASITIGQPVAQTITGVTSLCMGSTTTYSSTTSGGSWTSGTPSNATIHSTSGLITPVAAGTSQMSYSVTANGCVNTASKTITINSRPTDATLSGSGSICSGSSKNLAVAITGGTANYTVVYNPGGVSLSNYASNQAITVSPSATTNYSLVSVTDANGCTASSFGGTPTVSVNSRPTAAVMSGDATICVGTSTNLAVAITGGNAPYSIVYSPGAITQNNNNANATISVSPSSTTTYGLTSVTDVNGCTVASPTGSAVITVNQLAAITSHPSNVTVCSGTGASFTVGATGVGLTYQWRKGGVNVQGANAATYTITNTTPSDVSNYDVVVGSGCNVNVTSNAASLLLTLANNWTGATDNDWFKASNWSCGIIPNANLNAIIPSPLSQPYPVVSSGNTAIANGIALYSAATLTLQSATSKLQVYGDWANAGTFTANSGTVELLGTNAQQVSNTSALAKESFYNLTINKSTGTVSIASNVDIQAGATLSLLAGTLDVATGKKVTLKSAAPVAQVDQTARLGRVSGTITSTSDFAVERYLSSPSTRTPYVSITKPSPTVFLAPAVSGITAEQWTDDMVTYYMTKSSTLAYYSELNATGTTLQNRVDRGWRYVMANTTPLSVGRGYKVSAGLDNTDDLVSVTGKVVTGAFSIPVTYTEAATQGWNLVGNPYACEINWQSVYNLGANSNVVEPVIYIMDPMNSSFNNSSYYVYHAATGITVDPRSLTGRDATNGMYIASSQAFFVKAIANGNLTFNETVKPLAPFASVYGNFRKDEGEVLRLNVSNGTYGAQTVVHVKDGASNKYEAMFDAEMMSSGQLNLSTESAERHLAINGLASLNEAVPVIVESKTKGKFTFQVGEMTMAKACYLHDKFNNVYTRLEEGSEYEFDITDEASTSSADRFELVSEAPVVAGLETETASTASAMSFHPNPYTSGMLTIQVTDQTAGDGILEVMDGKGVLVYKHHSHLAGHTVHADLSDAKLTAGVYTVKYTVNGQSHLRKLVVH